MGLGRERDSFHSNSGLKEDRKESLEQEGRRSLELNQRFAFGPYLC